MVILFIFLFLFLVWVEHHFNLHHDTPTSMPQHEQHHAALSPYDPSPSCPSAPKRGEPVRIPARFRRREGDSGPDLEELTQDLEISPVLILKNTEKAETKPQDTETMVQPVISHEATVPLTHDAEIQTIFQQSSEKTQTDPIIPPAVETTATAVQSVPEIPDNSNST